MPQPHSFAKIGLRHTKPTTLWAEGYYVSPAGHVNVETIQRYIDESHLTLFAATGIAKCCQVRQSLMPLLKKPFLCCFPHIPNFLRKPYQGGELS
jgi:hypothetical protein